MKSTCFLLCLLLPFVVLAQPKKQKPPSNKEIADMMKEAEAAMSEMSAEDKRLLDSMGIKMPSAATLQQAAAYASKNNGKEVLVPARDAGRIASLPKTPLNAATLPSYLQTIDAKLKAQLPEKFVRDAAVLQQFIETKQETGGTGNAGAGMWLTGKPELALLLLSTASRKDVSDADNLNNFAAVLTMSGAEHMALPILNFLNSNYPKNSTILNNLAHAWFGLGDLANAARYTDSTLMLCAWHPQANAIRARMEEEKGHKAEAVTALKRSLRHMYSNDREQQLNKLGQEMTAEDISWSRPWLDDGLGLARFEWPDYPRNVKECEDLEKQWNGFRMECNAKLAELEPQLEKLEAQWQKIMEEKSTQYLQAASSGNYAQMAPSMNVKAMIKLQPLLFDADGMARGALPQKQWKAYEAANQEMEERITATSKKLNRIEEAYRDLFGEGKPNPFQEYCAQVDDANNDLLNNANTLMRDRFRDLIRKWAEERNDMLYYYLYAGSPEEFELWKMRTKVEWLKYIRDQKMIFRKPSQRCVFAPAELDLPPRDTLVQFDDINCQYTFEFNFIFGSIKGACSRVWAEMDVDFVKLKMETKMSDRDGASFLDELQRGTVEIGYKKGTGYGKGPLKLEAKAGVSAFVEVNGKGFTDAGIKLTGDVKVGTNIVKQLSGTEKVKNAQFGAGPIKDASVSVAGVEAKISINSGFSVKGKGLLK